MCTFADDLLNLVKRGIITPEEAYNNAIDKPFIQKKFEEEKIDFDPYQVALADIDFELDSNADAAKSEKALRKLHVNPRDTAALRELILILATDEGPEERNGSKALEYAKKLLEITGHSDALALMLLRF
jgi:thioredoxin-like negative regulator of GroEL